MEVEDYPPTLALKILRRCANGKCEGCPVSEFNCQGKLLDAVEAFIQFEDPGDAASFQDCHHGNMEEDLCTAGSVFPGLPNAFADC